MEVFQLFFKKSTTMRELCFTHKVTGQQLCLKVTTINLQVRSQCDILSPRMNSILISILDNFQIIELTLLCFYLWLPFLICVDCMENILFRRVMYVLLLPVVICFSQCALCVFQKHIKHHTLVYSFWLNVSINISKFQLLSFLLRQ